MKTDNTLPSGIHDLLSSGGLMAEGLDLHAPFLKMTQTPAEEFRILLERVGDAETQLSAARVAKGEAGRESTAADAALNRWMTRAKPLLMNSLGQQWSERWLQAGFTHRSTAVPKRMGERIQVARGMMQFFALHPELAAVAAKALGVTGDEALDRLLGAQQALRAAKVLCATRKRTRDILERKLRQKMRQVVVILGVTIRANDQRWLAFGLNRPARAAGGRRPALPAIEHAEVIALPKQSEASEPMLREASAA